MRGLLLEGAYGPGAFIFKTPFFNIVFVLFLSLGFPGFESFFSRSRDRPLGFPGIDVKVNVEVRSRSLQKENSGRLPEALTRQD